MQYHAPRQQGRARHLDELATQTDTQLVALQRETDPPVFMFFRSCTSGRDIFEHSFMVANVMSGRSWDKQFSRAATARNMVVSSRTRGVGAGLAPSSPQALITFFTWRGSASIQSPGELHRTVLLRIWSCLSRFAASPIICVLISYLSLNFRISHSASSLEALTMTSSPWTEALIHRAASEYKHVLACPLRKPISSKKPPSCHSQF